MNIEAKIAKLRKAELIFELVTWAIIIIATAGVILFVPTTKALNSLLYVLAGATVSSSFWYLRSRRLYVIAMQNAEEALEKSRELSKQQKTAEIIFDHSSDGILVIDDEKRIVSFSKGLSKMTGFSKHEVLGRKADQILKFAGRENIPSLTDIIFYPKDFIRKKYRIGSYLDNTIVTKQGKLVETEITFDSFEDLTNSQIMALAVLRDVSYEKEIRERDREFVSMASHQIFTPLSMIRGFLSLILQSKDSKINPKEKDYSEKAYEASKRLVSFVGSLLSTSRIEAERVTLVKKEFDINKLVNRLAEDYKKSANNQHNQLTLKISNKPLPILADEEKITQAISNCLDNAVKYTQNGNISLSTDKHQSLVTVTITDTGIGIPKEDINRIGTKFFRSKNAISEDTKGTGLGMFVAFYLVKKHGGNIEVESEEGKGTKIVIKLPQNNSK